MMMLCMLSAMADNSTNSTIVKVYEPVDYEHISALIRNNTLNQEQTQLFIQGLLAKANADQQTYFQNTVLPSIEKLEVLEAQVHEKQVTIDTLLTQSKAMQDSVSAMNLTFSLRSKDLEATNQQYSWIIIAMIAVAGLVVAFMIHERKGGRII